MATPHLFISTSSTDANAIAWLNRIFYYLVEQSVSDLHILSYADGWEVKMRSSIGSMTHIQDLDKTMGTIVLDRIRSRCNLANSETYKPQDGRFSLTYFLGTNPKTGEPEVIFDGNIDENDFEKLDFRRVDVRVAILPTIDSGSCVVCRVLDQQRSAMPLDQLGLDARYLQALRQVVLQPDGLFLVTGPTGSGKTTTLYSLVRELHNGTRNIITVENPVEYVVRGLVQIQVEHQHTSFAEMLRTVLRADPDVILVGEIRDAETAAIAVQAAMTGHLVLATLHTNDALSAPLRLLDLGVDPKLLAIALRGVCAQRLLPRISGVPDLRPTTDIEDSWLDLHGVPSRKAHIPTDDSAVHGVFPLIELVLVDDRISDILASPSLSIRELSEEANKQPWYDTLAQAASFSVLQGKARMSDAQKIIPSSDNGHGNMRCASVSVQEGRISLDLALKVLHIQSIWRFSGVKTSFRDVLAQVQLWMNKAVMDRKLEFGIDISEISDSDINRYFPQLSGIENTQVPMDDAQFGEQNA